MLVSCGAGDGQELALAAGSLPASHHEPPSVIESCSPEGFGKARGRYLQLNDREPGCWRAAADRHVAQRASEAQRQCLALTVASTGQQHFTKRRPARMLAQVDRLDRPPDMETTIAPSAAAAAVVGS